MKKQNALTVFYVAYFVWLFAIVFLSRAQEILGYFVIIVLAFYLLLLRDKWDVLVLFATVSIYYLIDITTLSMETISYDFGSISASSLWLPLTWGTTVLALKKFYTISTKR